MSRSGNIQGGAEPGIFCYINPKRAIQNKKKGHKNQNNSPKYHDETKLYEGFAHLYTICIQISNWWGFKLYLDILLIGEGMAYAVTCPFRALVVLYRILAIHIVNNEMFKVSDTVSTFLSISPGCICPRIFFSNNGLDNLSWALLYQIHIKNKQLILLAMFVTVDKPLCM